MTLGEFKIFSLLNQGRLQSLYKRGGDDKICFYRMKRCLFSTVDHSHVFFLLIASFTETGGCYNSLLINFKKIFFLLRMGAMFAVTHPHVRVLQKKFLGSKNYKYLFLIIIFLIRFFLKATDNINN